MELLKKIFTGGLLAALEKINFEKLFEVRLRFNSPITVNFGGKYCYISKSGICYSEQDAMLADGVMIESIVFNASNHSIYAVNNQLQQAFLTTKGGVRIGICGELVIENEKVVTIKNFSSLNVRIPHQVKNCSLNAVKYLIDEEGFKNTLVISPPGAGKTTFIRDIAFQLSNFNLSYNLLVLDERFEIAAVSEGKPHHNVGKFTDVLSGCTKQYGFTEGVRSMRPDIIFTDEIASKSDCEAIVFAANSGVKIVATTHAFGINDFKSKPNFENIVENQIFERYVVLSNSNGPGTYEGIFDKRFVCLYCR